MGLGEVGLVLSIDVTRLARNCSDWYPLLDICALGGCLIADRDGVYDPGFAERPPSLGAQGHDLRAGAAHDPGPPHRRAAGQGRPGRAGAHPAGGLVRGPGERGPKDPDLEVQARLGLVFASFQRLTECGGGHAAPERPGLDLPRRDRHGDLRWTRPTVAAVTTILKNPAYAGAFVYGRKRMTDRMSRGGGRGKTPRRAMADWRIVVKDRYPACIDWRTFREDSRRPC